MYINNVVWAVIMIAGVIGIFMAIFWNDMASQARNAQLDLIRQIYCNGNQSDFVIVCKDKVCNFLCVQLVK